MRVAINLMDLSGYVDRFRMLCRLADEVSRLYLLTDRLPAKFAAEVKAHPNMRVVALGRARFRGRAHAWLDAQLDGPGLEIVHDTFGHLADWMQARARDPWRRVRFLTTQYTTNHDWFTQVRTRPGHGVDWAYGVLRLVSYWRDRRVCRAADCSVVLGPGHERALVEGHGVAPDRVVWLPSEIDTERFCVGPKVARSAGPVLLFTGAVIRNKGVDLLVEVARRLRPQWPGLRLLLVGRVPGPERPWLARLVASSGLGEALEVRPALSQAALMDLYRSAEVYVLPSLFEGSPRSLREALACGCRAVASDIPGNRGIDPAGDYVRFAPVDDVGAWVEACSAMLAESDEAAQARSARGVAGMQARHGLVPVARAWVGVYRRLLEMPPNVI